MKHLVPIIQVSFFILACSALCLRCRPTEDQASFSLVSKNGKTVAVIIRGSLVKEKDISTKLKLRLIKPGARVPVLGHFRIEGDEVIFEPVVPLTKGLRYEVLLNDSLLSEIEVPVGDSAAPALISMYPSQDTLPENLLKMYFEFSEPMVEGSSLQHLTLIRNDGDTMRGTFLDLQPELWNSDGTLLTLWLDPGRIKRDLIPNKELGNPLKQGERYTLHVNKTWQSKNGVQLTKNYSKTFVAIHRDEKSPDPMTWKVLVPPSNNRQSLEIQFPQPLDYSLLRECVTILNSHGDVVAGEMVIGDEERVLRFVPDEPWTKGKFALRIESRLEDLAGNNLNRPFDRDVEKEKATQEQPVLMKNFEVQ
jgi:hypothetical protein